MKKNSSNTNFFKRMKNSIFNMVISLLILHFKFAESQLCRITDSFATVRDSTINVDNTCLKTLSTDSIFNTKLTYSYDGYGLTSLSLGVTKNGGAVMNLNPIQGAYLPANSAGVVNFDLYEYVKTIQFFFKNDWLTALRIITSKKTVDVGNPGVNDNVKYVDIFGDLVGLKASAYVNGITSLQFYVVRNCLPGCATCATTLDSCDSCVANQSYKYTGTIFPTRCYSSSTLPDGWFIDAPNNDVKPCDRTSCITCTVAANSCSQCATNYYWKSPNTDDKRCYNTRPATAYYLDIGSSPFYWKACDSSCLDCEFRAKNCLSCANNCYPMIGLNNNVCYCSKPLGYYLDSTAVPKVYKPCNSPCKDCTSANLNSCLTCVDTYFFKKSFNTSGDTCYNSAPASNFALDTGVNPNLWTPCHNACLTCTITGLANPICLTCNNNGGFYFYLDNLNAPKQCYPINNKPYSNTYLNTATSLWQNCSSNCATCNQGGQTKCLTCSSNYYFKVNNSAEDECFVNTSTELQTSGWYLDISNNLWKNCISPCANCQLYLGALKCVTCIGGYFFKYPKNSNTPADCFTGILDNFYYSTDNGGSYLACSSNCLRCTGSNSNQCSTCTSLFYFKEDAALPNTCFSSGTIGDGFFLSSGVWKPCLSPCKNCVTNDTKRCLSCITSYYLQENYDSTNGDICYSDKPASNYFLDSAAQLYKKCSLNCATCNSLGENQCQTCAVDNYPKFNFSPPYQCYFNAPAKDWFYDSASTPKCWKQCNSLCGTCSGTTANDCLTCTSTSSFKSDTNVRPNQCFLNSSSSR